MVTEPTTEETMSASLFDLISLTGSASLDELRARSSVDDLTLANTVANMVVSGAVALSVTPEFKTGLAPQGGPNAPEVVIYLLGKSTDGEFRNAPTMKIDDLKHAIQLVLQNEGAAELITASPTSRGFRHSF
jgi:hypothetical protein